MTPWVPASFPTLGVSPERWINLGELEMHRVLTASIVVLLFLIACAFPTLAQFEEGRFQSDGVEIRYVTAGDGEPVILIHGFSASAAANWMLPGVFTRLAENFQVIAIDARGHGGSGKPHEPTAYGEQMAQDVIRLLDHLEIDRAHVGGYSMGGFITMKLLTLAPERLRSAIVGGAGWMRPEDDPSLTEALAASLESGGGMTPLLEELTPEGETMAPEAIQAMNAQVLATNDPLALAAVARAMPTLAVEQEQIEFNTVPVLVVIGSKDPLKEGVDAMADVLGNHETTVVDGADHLSILINPAYAKQMADAMETFLLARCECE